MLQLGPADNCCEAIQMQLAMMQITFHAYNASSQLVSSIISRFAENPNARKVNQVGMANPYHINGMETQGFPSAKNPTPFRGTGPAA